MEMGCLTALFMGSNGLLHDNSTTQMLVFIELANPIVKGFDWTFLRNLQVHKLLWLLVVRLEKGVLMAAKSREESRSLLQAGSSTYSPCTIGEVKEN